MPGWLFRGHCEVPRFKEEAKPRRDKDVSVHSEARFPVVGPSWRGAGCRCHQQGGRNQKEQILSQVALQDRTLLVTVWDRWCH